MNHSSPNLPLTVLSPAKVNLFLRVGRQRPDGFHPLVSWFCSVTLADELVFSFGEEGVKLSCDRADVPCDERNLVLKAAGLLRPYASRSISLQIRLLKRVPMGGGLGGGSSNGAAALMTLNDIWQCGLSLEQLHGLAAQLGSDVPFFLHAPSAICRGRGELVSPHPLPGSRWALVILPGIEMPTPAVFRRFDEMNLGSDLSLAESELPHSSLNAEALLASLCNDLEAPAFAISPELARLRTDLENQLNRPVRMSGSGSTLFTLYDGQEECVAAAGRIAGKVRSVPCRLG